MAENSEDAQNAEDEDDDVEATQDKMHEGMEEEGLDTIDVVCAKKLPAQQPQPGQLKASWPRSKVQALGPSLLRAIRRRLSVAIRRRLSS